MSQLEDLIQTLCPNGVEYKELGDAGKFFGGLTGKSKEDFQNGNRKYISYMNVYKNPSVDITAQDFVSINPDERQNEVNFGDILFTGSSETPEECGISSVMVKHPDEPIYLNSFTIGFRLHDSSILIPDFSKHLFRSAELRKQINKTASGVTRFNVSKARLSKVVIPTPPLPVQEEILRILDTFSSAVTELEAEQAARVRQYEHYRNQLFDITGDDSVSCIPLESVIISLKTGLNPRKNFQLNTEDAKNHYVTVRELAGKDIRIFDKTDKVNDEALRLINNRSNLEVNDILFSGTGTVGRTAIVQEPPFNWNIKEGVYVIKPDTKKINPFYLLYLLQSDVIKKKYEGKIVGSPVISLPMYELRKLLIPLPSLEMQEQIVSILDRFDALVNDLKSGLPAEIAARRKQYEYYRDRLLTFKPKPTS